MPIGAARATDSTTFSELEGPWRDACGVVARIRRGMLILLPGQDAFPITMLPRRNSRPGVRYGILCKLFGESWEGLYLSNGRIQWLTGDIWHPCKDMA